jgi:hypothetical protein
MPNILRKYYHRNFLYILIAIILLILSFWVGTAYGTTPQKVRVRPEMIIKRPEFKPSVIVTTTTLPPVVKAKVAVIPDDSSPIKVVEIQIPVADWVAQCHAWASEAGIELPPSAIKLLDRESDCNPTIKNPNSSAGGIPQALPYTKMGCPLEYTDAAAICQLQWFHGYVMQRYGSWDNALAHSSNYGWY